MGEVLKLFIVCIALIIGSTPVFCQGLRIKEPIGYPELQSSGVSRSVSSGESTLRPLRYWFITPISLPATKELSQQSVIRTNPAHAFQELGVICKWEYRLEQAVQFPVKFRLGEYHYVQMLEGKSLHNNHTP